MKFTSALKTVFVLFILISSAISVKASHSAGGFVTAEYLGQNLYLINATVQWNGSSQMNPLTVTACGVSQTMATVSTRTYTGLCGATMYEITQSATVSLPTIPVAGCEIKVDFNTPINGLDNSENILSNVLVEYKMKIFPGSKLIGAGASPKFLVPSIDAYVEAADMTFSLNAFDAEAYDSLYYELDDPFGAAVTYSTGYSKSHPFGDTVATVLNPNTGILFAQNLNIGQFMLNKSTYMVSVRLESYKNGVLHYTTYKTYTLKVVPSAVAGAPAINLGNLNVQNGIQVNTTSFEIEEGGILEFDVHNILASNQTIESIAYGKDLSLANGGLSMANDAANYTFSAGGGSGVGIVNGSFKFQPDFTFVDTLHAFRNTQFLFRATVNDNCGLKETYTVVNVKVLNSAKSIYANTYQISQCGTSSNPVHIFGDTTNLSWSPTLGVSNSAGSEVWLNPPVTTSYTVTNLNDSSQIHILVKVVPLSFALQVNSNLVTLPTSIDSTNVFWFYNGLSLGSGMSEIETNVSGYYWAEFNNGSCTSFSDTIHKVELNEIFVSGLDSSAYSAAAQLGYSEFSVTPNKDLNLGEVSVIIPKSKVFNHSGTVGLKVFEKGQSQPKFVSTLVYLDDMKVYEMGLSSVLENGKEYIFKIEIPDWEVSQFSPQAWPFVSYDGSVSVNSGYSIATNGDTLLNQVVPFVFGLNSTIGIDENENLDFALFPNPTTGLVFFKDIIDGQINIYTLNGVQISSHKASENLSLDLSQFAKGVYLIELVNKKGSSIKKLILH